LAGTVLRPKPRHLKDVRRGRGDADHMQPYKDSLQLESNEPASNNAPYISNLQTIPIATDGPEQ
jgi:hypothetical protein